MRRIALIGAAMFIIGACGGDGSPGAGGTTSPSPTASRSLPAGSVEVADGRYVPAAITVTRGTTVTWINSGVQPHDVVSFDKLFNSHPNCTGAPTSTTHTGCLAVGETFRYTFTKPGDFLYYCSKHAACDLTGCRGMKGTVTVT